MKCEEVKTQLKIFLEDRLEDETFGNFHDHLGKCLACRQYISGFGSLVNDFRELAAIPIPREIFDRVLSFIRKQKWKRKLSKAVFILIVLGAMGSAYFFLRPHGREQAATETETEEGTAAHRTSLQVVPTMSRGKRAGASSKDAEQLAKLKKMIDDEKEKAAKGQIAVTSYLGEPGRGSEVSGAAPVAADFSQTDAGSAKEGKEAEDGGVTNTGDKFQWLVALDANHSREDLMQSLKGSEIHPDSAPAELMTFHVSAAAFPEFSKSLKNFPTLTSDLEKIPADKIPKEGTEISLVLYSKEKKSGKEPPKDADQPATM